VTSPNASPATDSPNLDADQRAVVAAEDRLRAAELARDRRTMDAVITDDFVGHGYAGQAIGKQAYIDVHADPAAGEGVFTRFDVDRDAVTIMGDVAVVRGRQDVAAHVRLYSRYVSLYRRQAGGWRLFFWQETPVVDPATVRSNRRLSDEQTAAPGPNAAG
jgi:ketosteroid isomerase-like protein